MIKKEPGHKIICLNRKASFNFFFQEILEAGIVLRGSEIKSVRAGNVNIAESYAIEKDGEFFLVNSHIPIYKEASFTNHNPREERKLLLNKRELDKMLGSVKKDGFSIVPISLYFNENGLVKLNIGLGKGKKKFDKRESQKLRDWNKKKQRLLKNN